MLGSLDNSSSNTAADSEVTGNTGSLTQRHFILDGNGLEVHFLGLEHALQFLEGQNEVDVGTDTAAAGLQLLGGAGTNEGDLSLGMLHLQHTGGQNHGRHSHGDVHSQLGELLLGHDRPCGAAGSSHEGLVLGNFTQEVLSFLNGAQVGADSDFHHIGEAQLLHSSGQTGGSGVGTKLAVEGGSNASDVAVTLLDGVDQLEDLALVGDSAEGAGNHTHTAGHALVVVDLGAAMLIGLDGVHAAGSSTGALLLNDGIVGAGVGALTALDALGLINDRLALDEADSAAGADFVAVVRQAALAAFSHVVTVGGASVTGVADDVHQGGIIVLFGNGALIDTVGQTGVLGNRAQRQAHSQTQALADNGALQEDGLAILGQLAGSDLVGQVLDTAVVAALIGQTSDLGEDLLAVSSHGSCDTAGLSEIHSNSPLSITIFCVYFNTYLA